MFCDVTAFPKASEIGELVFTVPGERIRVLRIGTDDGSAIRIHVTDREVVTALYHSLDLIAADIDAETPEAVAS